MATIRQLTFMLEALSLFARRIVIPSVALDTPVITLKRDKQNRNNRMFGLTRGEGSNKKPSDWKLDLCEITLSRGSPTLDDGIKRIHLTATVDAIDNQTLYTTVNGTVIKNVDQPTKELVVPGITASTTVVQTPAAPDPQQPYGIAQAVKGTYNNAAITGSGKAGGVFRLQDAQQPYPLQADVTVGEAHIDLAGTPTNLASLTMIDLRLHLSGTGTTQLYPLTGVVLPDASPFDIRDRLIGELRKRGSTWRYEKFTGRVGDPDLGGTFAYTMCEPHPQLTGELVSHQLLSADLVSVIGADPNASKTRRVDPSIDSGNSKTVHQPADKVLPVKPLRTGRWNTIDTDVKFTGKRIVHTVGLPTSHLVTHVELQDVVLTLGPLNFGVVGGTLSPNIQLGGHATPVQARVALAARHFKIKQLFPKIGSARTSVDKTNGGVRLSATDSSVSALLGSLNGKVKILVEQGIINKFILEAMGLNVGNVIPTKLFGDKQVTTNYAAGDFTVSNGLAQARTFAMDTQDAVINVAGVTSFKQGALDFIVHPDSKRLRAFSLHTSLYVKGTYKYPDMSVNPAVVVLWAGSAVALVLTAPVAAVLPVLELESAPESTCGKLLADVRQRSITSPSGQAYHSKKPDRTSEGDLKSTQPDSGKTATSQHCIDPPPHEPLTTDG